MTIMARSNEQPGEQYLWKASQLIPWLMMGGLACLVITTSTNVPWWDEWHFVDILDKYYTGQLTFQDLAAPHNNIHRIFFPRLILLVLAVITHWNLRIELLPNLAIAAGIYVFYKKIILEQLNLKSRLIYLALPVTAVFVFSLKQNQNWMWGWQIQIFLCVYASLFCLYILSFLSYGRASVYLAVACAFVASFSFADGLLLWPIGLAVLWCHRSQITNTIIWLISAAVCFILYFQDYQVQLLFDISNVRVCIEFVIVYIAGAICNDQLNVAFRIGVLGVLWAMLLIAALYRKEKTFSPTLMLLISIIGYVLASAGLASLARFSMGNSYGMESRYSSISIHFWIALVCLSFYYMENYIREPTQNTYRVLMVAILVVSAAAIKTSLDSIKWFYVFQHYRTQAVYVLEHDVGPEQTTALKGICWDEGFVLARVPILKKYHLSLFYR